MQEKGEHPFRDFRRRGGMKVRDMARRLGVDRTTLHRYESGKLRIPAERALEIERLTGIPRHQLRPDLFGSIGSAKASTAG